MRAIGYALFLLLGFVSNSPKNAFMGVLTLPAAYISRIALYSLFKSRATSMPSPMI